MKMLTILEKLKKDAWRTAGARYNAARRLKRRDLFATISLSAFSAIGVGLAVAQNVYSPTPGSSLDNYLTILSVCLSVFLLVISLVEWGSANSVMADRLHQNAEELSAFWRRLEVKIHGLKPDTEISPDDALTHLKEYEEIKARCSVNHAPLDDKLFVATQRHAAEFVRDGKQPYNWIEQHWLALRAVFSSTWYFVLLWLIIVALIYLTPWNQVTSSSPMA